MRTMGEKLSKALQADTTFKPVSLTVNDGKTHINVDNSGKTVLGRQLSHFAKAYFRHPIYGHFRSVQGFMEWFRSEERPDILRRLDGKAAKETARGFTKQRRIENFREEITMAAWYKITQNESIWMAMIASELPFKSYYQFGPQKVEIGATDDGWYVQVLERIRRHLKTHGPEVMFDYNKDLPFNEGSDDDEPAQDESFNIKT